MDRELHEIATDDQFDTDRREARRLALALAGDVVAYHNVLFDADIPEPLRATLVEQFGAAWLGTGHNDTQIVLGIAEDDA